MQPYIKGFNYAIATDATSATDPCLQLTLFACKAITKQAKVGARAMTTKFLDDKICTFKILLSWRFPRKQAFWGDFPLRSPSPPPPQKRKYYFYCRLAVSEKEQI